MCVGGKLIEILPMKLSDGRDVVRLWVFDPPRHPGGVGDEACVYAEPQESMPRLGEGVWWQGGQIMFDGDRQTLRKIGYSFSPRHA